MLTRLALGAACLLATTAVASAEMMWGVNGHPITAYPGIAIERQLDLVKELGTTSYRVNISDMGGAEALASLVAAGKLRDVTILPVLTPGNVDLDADSADDLYKKARELSVALASRFKNDIRVWELGNEMENDAIIQPCEMRDDGTKYPCEWGPAGGTTALDYYGPRWVKVSAVLRGLSDGMIEVDPQIRKAMGTAGWGHTGAFQRMKQDGIQWDISVWHMYGEDPEWAFRELAEYKHPIWVTEFNYPKGSESGDRQQAVGLKHTMARLKQLKEKYSVEAAHIYELLDEPYWAPSFEASMGLVRLTAMNGGKEWALGEPKPAYLTVREFIRGPQPAPRPRRDCELSASETIESVNARQASFAYCLVLGRQGSSDDIERWAMALEYGETNITDMLVSLLRSDAFSERYPTFGMSDRVYIDFIFKLLLGREADNYGVDTYARQLADGTMTREAVAVGIIWSSEFQSKHAVNLGTKDPNSTASVPPG